MSTQAQISPFAKIQVIQSKFHLARQAIFLSSNAGVVLVLAIIDAILWRSFEVYYFYVPGPVIWLILLSIITMAFAGTFLARERALAAHPDYLVSYPKVIAPVILTILWFSSSIAPLSTGTVGLCLYAGLACGPVGALMDLFAWIEFGMLLTFALTVVGQAQKQQLFVRSGIVPLQTMPVQAAYPVDVAPNPYGVAPSPYPAAANVYATPGDPYQTQGYPPQAGQYPPQPEGQYPHQPVYSPPPHEGQMQYQQPPYGQ